MSQSTLIVGALIAAFFVWVVLRNRLPVYMADLGIGQNAATAPSTTAGNYGDFSGAAAASGGTSLASVAGQVNAAAGGVNSFNSALASIQSIGAPATTQAASIGVGDFGGGGDGNFVSG